MSLQYLQKIRATLQIIKLFVAINAVDYTVIIKNLHPIVQVLLICHTYSITLYIFLM